MNLDVPDFLEVWGKKWIGILGLAGWEIHLFVVPVVQGDPDVRAECVQSANLNRCDLYFRHDVEQTADWEACMVHELLHVAHTRIDALIERGLIANLPEPAQPLALETYVQAYESFVHRLAVCLVNSVEERLDAPGNR